MTSSVFRRPAALLGALLLTLTTACADTTAPTTPGAPTFGKAAPAPAPTAPSGAAVTGLLWARDVGQATASAVIGSAGGTLALPDGLRLIVPKGAVSRNVTFSVTRLPGRIVAYDFQPHGTTFAVPLQLEQPTAATNLQGLASTAGVEGAYFADDAALNQAAGTATVAEFRPTTVSSDRAWVRFTVDHFSGYMLSSGRK